MSHRSPLSYNIGASKSSPMNGLSYDKFQRDNDKDINAKKVLEIHNNNVGSFYNHPMSSEYESSSSSSLYDEMIEKLSELMKPSGEGGEDLSDLSGDPLSQVYYYSLTAIMLYFLYRLLYSKRK
jgi:hypothetical protein